jgi:hypothetical protein
LVIGASSSWEFDRIGILSFGTAVKRWIAWLEALERDCYLSFVRHFENIAGCSSFELNIAIIAVATVVNKTMFDCRAFNQTLVEGNKTSSFIS